MKKLFVFLFLAVSVAVSGWSTMASAADGCADAVFQCQDGNEVVLGTINIPCSMQRPYNDLIPKCLPDMGGDIFRPVTDCKAKWRTAVYACPTQSWPSGYNYSSCMHYPF